MVLALVASAASAAPVEVHRVRAEIRTGTMAEAKGKRYLRVTFTVVRRGDVAPGTVVMVRAAAGNGAARVSDDVRALGLKLSELPPGTEEELALPLFMTDGLAPNVDRCDLTFLLVQGRERDGPRLAQYCFARGAVSSGACRP